MFKYYGSKHKIAALYPRPQFDLCIEPFAGSAAYSVLHRRLFRRVVLTERDRAVADLWKRLLASTATQLTSARDPVAGERSTDLLVALAAGRTTRDTPASFVVSPRMAQRFRPMVTRMAAVLDECRHFEVVCGDYTVSPDEEAVWFIDPPYRFAAGRWDRSRGGRYKHGSADINYDHLARWCSARRGQVIVCEQEGADWLPFDNTADHRSGTHGVYKEVWMHRPGDLA